MPLTLTDRKFLKSLRIQQDDDLKDSTLAIFGRCRECYLPLRPDAAHKFNCIGGCPPRRRGDAK